jgi:hypothetical protein
MTVAMIIDSVARETGQPIQAVETAAVLSAPFISGTKAQLSKSLSDMLRAEMLKKLNRQSAAN